MNGLKAPSLLSLNSDRASNDSSSYTEYNLQLDLEELDDTEYSLPPVDGLPTLESVLHDLDSELDNASDSGNAYAPTPTPSTESDGLSRVGSMLRHSIMQGVSNQISTAADRVFAGLASALAVDQMIAVGTSHGHILCFDTASQVLRWYCQEYVSQGAVSSLSFNEDNSRLLVGFARGMIVMIDTGSGDVIRALADAITPNAGVLVIKWTGRPTLALCLDSGGSVWSLSFTRRLGIRSCDSRCLFSGARGEVCTVEPLIISDDSHPLKPYSLVALATLSKFFVVTIRPRLKVIKIHAVPGPPDSLPLIAWQMVLIQAANSSRSVDPVLAAGRGNLLFFHQVYVHQGKVSLLSLRQITLGYSLLALHWLGPKTLAACDRTEMLHLLEVRTNRDLEHYDLTRMGLVYNSAQFKGFATGGNVSPALALAGTFACYNSIIALENQLYVLGSRSVHVVSVRPWSDRISHLSANHKWAEAIQLAVEGFRSSREKPKRQEIARNRILQLIEEYLAATAKSPDCCLEAVMRCLIEIQETKILWEELWDRLDNTDHYLSLLTEHIESGAVSCVATSISQRLCEYWAKISIVKLEEILLKLDWQCLDLHQVITLAKQRDMYRLQMHLNTKALNDYTVSLVELLPKIGTSTSSDLGNYMLVYISSCLAGRGYPSGEIAADIVQSVRHEVLRCLTVIHSRGATEDELKYPYLRALLVFDTRETLNVISLAFQEKEFAGDLGLLHRQRIVNILLEIVLTPEHDANASQIGCLMHFISNQLVNKCLPEDPALIERIMSFVTSDGESEESARTHTDRESAWMDLLMGNFLDGISNFEMTKMAKAAKCYRVLEYLYERNQSYDEILQCYLLDRTRHFELFSYLRRHADHPERELFAQMTHHLKALIAINCVELCKVIVDCMPDRLPQLFRSIDKDNAVLFQFMDEFRRLNVVFENSTDCERYIDLLCRFESKSTVLTFLQSHPINKYRLDVALETVKKYGMNAASVFLYERQGDYMSAFALSLDLLKGATTEPEKQALQIASLCERASETMSDAETEEIWFTFLPVVLSRSADLTAVTKTILHMASSHVDLSKLVQLVLNSGTKSGNFGDIRTLLMSMLANSQYETMVLETTARILGDDLHRTTAQEMRRAKHGLAIRMAECVDCGRRLRIGESGEVVVLGTCGHPVHRTCFESLTTDALDNATCPRCRKKTSVKNTMKLGNPKESLFEREDDEAMRRHRETGTLHLSAPPRIGI